MLAFGADAKGLLNRFFNFDPDYLEQYEKGHSEFNTFRILQYVESIIKIKTKYL